MAKQLTELQQKFLEALFGEAEGDFEKAKIIAGYSKATAAMHIVATLREEIVDQAQLFLALNAPKASRAVVGVMEDPVALGNKEKLAAATQILDRVGVSKQERIDLNTNAQTGIFILPMKRPINNAQETTKAAEETQE